MANIIITLENNINNVSLQVGDTAYYIDNVVETNGVNNSQSNPIPIGEIKNIGTNNITVDGSPPPDEAFLVFSKNTVVNNTSLLGYYAEVKLMNDSEHDAELFVLSSEVASSSK